MDSKYGPVSSDEELQFEEKSLLSPLPKYTQVVPPLKRYSTHPYIVWVLHGILLSFSLAFFVLSLVLRIQQPLSVGCSQASSPYCKSPVLPP